MKSEKNTAEFSEYDLGICRDEMGVRRAASLLLPRQECLRLIAEREQAEHERARAEAVEREAQAQSKKRAIPEADPDMDHDDDEKLSPDVEAKKGYAQALVPGQDYQESVQYLVYEPTAPIELLRRAKLTSNDDLKDREIEIFKLLRRRSPLRTLCNPALDADFGQRFEELTRRHAHFHKVIEFVSDTLSGMSGKVRRIPPILLLGPPGVGKSCFAQDLASALGANILQLQMDSAVTRMTLVGSDRRYSNTGSGELFNLICLRDQANPIVLLDELDKAQQEGRDSAITPLHGLLEPVTAKRCRDVSTEFVFDASLVTWIATANDVAKIPNTLRSRFREFVILPPKGAHAIEVSASVLKKVLSELAPQGFEDPAKSVAVALAHLTAREIYQATERAVANAVSNGKTALQIADFHADAMALEVDGVSTARKKSDGEWLH